MLAQQLESPAAAPVLVARGLTKVYRTGEVEVVALREVDQIGRASCRERV